MTACPKWRFKLASDEVAGDNAARFAVDRDKLNHFMAGIHGHSAKTHLSFKSLVGTKQKLLACLAACIECPGYLCAAKGTVVK
jgi:hypothetical protein